MASIWRKRTKRYALLAAVSLALVLGLIVEAGPANLADQLENADLALLAAVVLFYLTSIGLKALRWYVLLIASDHRVRGSVAVFNYSVGQALNDLTPVKVLGEGVRIWGINREEGVPIGSGLATVFTEKIMDLALVSVVLIASITLLYPDLPLGPWSSLSFVVGLVVMANLTVIVILRRPDLVEKLGGIAVAAVRKTGRRDWTERLDRVVRRTVGSFNQALNSSRGYNRGWTAAAVLITLPIWALEFARISFIMAALGAFAPLPAIIVASTLAITAQVFLPAGSGNVAVISDVFASMGIALATATAAGLLSVATSVWISVPVALAALLLSGKRLSAAEKDGPELI